MIVCNTSPLIALSILDKVDLIDKVRQVVCVAGFILKAKKLGLIAEIKPKFIKLTSCKMNPPIFWEIPVFSYASSGNLPPQY